MKTLRLSHLKDVLVLKLCRFLQREDEVFRTAALVRFKNETLGLEADDRRERIEDIYK